MDGRATLKVLLVDDEEAFLLTTGKVLRRRGLEVLTARDGREGLAVLDRETVDVVVLDVRMPGMDGDEVCRHIEQRHPGLPVIVLTGHGSVPQAFQTANGAVFDCLAKPCEVERLVGRIREAAAARVGGPVVPEPVPRQGERVSVLLVDDEEELLSSLERVLSRRGMQVATASSGEEALDHLTRQDADVVVLDIKMPGTDGLETLRRIKQLRPERQVILLTGHPSLENATAGMRLGAMEYLTKPPNVDHLTELIHEAWGVGRRARDADRRSPGGAPRKR